MNPFLRKILAVGQLTRQGKLAEATAAIQRALAPLTRAGTHTPPGTTASEVIDAEVIEMPVAERAVPEARAERATTVEAPARPDPADGTSAVEVVDEAPPALRPQTGTGRFVESTFTGAGGTRAFKVFVPDGFEGVALPLVVMLHGCTQNPDDFAAGTRMNVLAQEQGFVVLYPAQATRSNSHKCWNWFLPRDQRRGIGEPALLAGMTRHVLQTHSIDHDRVYVAGLSAGGAMAAILAREYPDLFAAVGVHSGVAPGMATDVQSAFTVMKAGPGAKRDLATALAPNSTATSRPASGVPVIVFHGDADRTVVPANGEAVVAATLGDTRGLVATASEGESARGARTFRRTVWRRSGDPVDAPSVAEHWAVDGSPHAWSGGAESGSFTDPAGPNASREMLRFFKEHPRRE